MTVYYNSNDVHEGAIGTGWYHNYEMILKKDAGNVFFRKGDGGIITYPAGGTTQPSLQDYSTLYVDSTYIVTYPDGTKYLFENTSDASVLRIKSINDRFGNSLAFAYFADTAENQAAGIAGRLEQVIDTSGRTTQFVYALESANLRLSKVIGPLGSDHQYEFKYFDNGMLQKIVYPVADQSSNRGEWLYTYEEKTYWVSGAFKTRYLLKTKKAPGNNPSSYAYNSDGRMISSVDPAGTDNPEGHTRVIEYHFQDQPLCQVGSPCSYVPPSYVVTTFTEKDNGQWLYRYDISKGVVSWKIDPNGKLTQYYYYSDKTLKAKTEPFDGDTKRLTTFYHYDAKGNLDAVTEPINLAANVDPETMEVTNFGSSGYPKWAFLYDYTDEFNRIIQFTDNRGDTPLVTTFTYSTEADGGEWIAILQPGNRAMIFKRNPNGTIKEIVDANNTVVADSTVTEKPGAKKAVLTYFPLDDTNRNLGRAGLLQTYTGTDGVTYTVTAYDKNGNVTAFTVTDANRNPVPRSTTLVFDNLNRLTRQTIASTATPSNFPTNVTDFGYDLVGNLTSLVDAETNSTSYQYNYNGQVTRIIEKINPNDTVDKETEINYSGSGCSSCTSGVNQVTSVRDDNHVKLGKAGTIFRYDKLGRLDKETDPVSKVTRYTYYDNGWLKGRHDATGVAGDGLGTQKVGYEYNNRGQLTKKNYFSNYSTTYKYYPDGKLQTAGNQHISYSYDYHADGRLKSVTDTNNRTISYDEYDGLGQRKKVTILKGAGADERVYTYDYDSANRPWKLYRGDHTNTYFEFLYDPVGRRQYLNNWQQGIQAEQTEYGYDDLDRLTSLTHTAGTATIAAFSYDSYDQVGNLKSRTTAAAELEQYVYDLIYRLTTVTAVKSEAFTYDPVGNRKIGPGVNDSRYEHDDANRLTKGRKLDYGYDNAGNQTTRSLPGASGKSWTQYWDEENRLMRVEKIKGAETRTVSFKYDPFGRRIEKQVERTVAGTTKTETYRYVYDNEDIALEIYSVNGTEVDKTYYVHGPGIDEPLALERGGNYYYYHADRLGSIVAITDGTHNIVQKYAYDAYGMVTPTTPFRNSYTYTGREWDKEAGLYYYRGRYYDPMDGHFISKDPIGFDGGDVNLYGYVKNNPINYVDPLGLRFSAAQILLELEILYYRFGPSLVGWAYGKANINPSQPDFKKMYQNYQSAMDKIFAENPPVIKPPPPGWQYDPVSGLLIPPKNPIIVKPCE